MQQADKPSGLKKYLLVLQWLPDQSVVRSLWSGGLGIALMSFTESIASARAFTKHGDRTPDPDQGPLALGIANIDGGFPGYASGGWNLTNGCERPGRGQDVTGGPKP